MLPDRDHGDGGLARRRAGLKDTARAIAKALFRNALMIGLGLGFIVNLSGLPLPRPLTIGVDMIADSALPAALFGLGAC